MIIIKVRVTSQYALLPASMFCSEYRKKSVNNVGCFCTSLSTLRVSNSSRNWSITALTLNIRWKSNSQDNIHGLRSKLSSVLESPLSDSNVHAMPSGTNTSFNSVKDLASVMERGCCQKSRKIYYG